MEGRRPWPCGFPIPKPPQQPPQPDEVCPNGHTSSNMDDERMCPNCQIKKYATTSWTLEKKIRVITDFGLYRCPNGHFYDGPSTTCIRCTLPPPPNPPPRSPTPPTPPPPPLAFPETRDRGTDP